MNVRREQTEHQTWQGFLAEAGAVLSSSLEVDATLEKVAELARARLADWCLVELVDDAGGPSKRVVRRRDAENGDPASEIRRRSPAHSQGPKSALPGLVMVVPMFARGRGIGTITFGKADRAAPFDAQDLVMAEQLAQRAALALDNARLYAAECQARESLTRINRVTAELAVALSPERIAEITIEHGAVALGARSAGLWLLERGRDELVLLRPNGFQEATFERFSVLALDEPAPLAEAVRRREPVFIESRARYAGRYGISAARTQDLTEASIQAVACLPLIAGGQVLGGIALAFEGVRQFAEVERRFLAMLADHCALALDRVALYEAELYGQAGTELLYALADATQRASSLEALYEAALDALSGALGTTRTAVLCSDEHDMMEFKASRGISERHRSALNGRMASPRNEQSAPPIIVSDAATDPKVSAFSELLAAEHIRALVLVPLVDRGGMVGMLAAYFERPRVISSEELRLTRAIASHVGEALARKHAEAEIARLFDQAQSARATAESAAESRERMLAVVAHDLRNLLHAAQLRSSLLIRRVTNKETNTLVHDDLDAIRSSMEGMSRLIDDLLDTAAIDTGRLSISVRRCTVDELFAEMLDTARLLAEDRAVEIICEARPSARTLCCDRERILQVLANLVSNAVKFSPRGGPVQLGCEHDSQEVVFAVRDRGPGIPAEARARVFDRYFKADDSRPGVGLGLYISKALVEAHQGRLWIESSPGSGTQVFVALPLSACDPIDHE